MEYLNKGKANGSKVIEIILFILGAFGALIWGAIGISAMTEEDPQYISVAVLSFGFAFFNVLLIYIAVKKHKMRTSAVRLNQLFLADEDGTISLEQIMIPLGAKNTLQAAKAVDRLIAKGYIKNCNVEYGGTPKIMLYKYLGGGAGNKAVNCPSCGASVSVRDGFVSECPYCGSKLN